MQRLGELLLHNRVITKIDLNAALMYQDVFRCKLGQALVFLHAVDEMTIIRYLACQLKQKILDDLNSSCKSVAI